MYTVAAPTYTGSSTVGVCAIAVDSMAKAISASSTAMTAGTSQRR